MSLHSIQSELMGIEVLSDALTDLWVDVSLGRVVEEEEQEEQKPIILPPVRDYTPYGAARQLWNSQEPQVIISGPAETGKSLACLHKLDAICWEYAGAQVAITRKTYASMLASILQTYENKVLGKATDVRIYGGTRPYMYEYPNGSQVWVCGLDNANKILSSEFDFIYVNQAEEIDQTDAEMLSTRCTGRAGNTPYPQLIFDCNPAQPKHWLKKKGDANPSCFFESRHRDNPTLFDPKTGKITIQGERSMKSLEALTGFLRSRLFLGLWAAAEGMVYEGSYDPKNNLKTWQELGWKSKIPPLSWRRIWVIDFGFQNPFCCQFWAIDHDGRMYRYREVYFSERLVSDHCSTILRTALTDARPSAIICDHDAEDRATFSRYNVFCIDCDYAIQSRDTVFHNKHKLVRFNLKTKAAYKAITVGVQNTHKRFKVAGDGKSRMIFVRHALVEHDAKLEAKNLPTCTEEEIEGYIYPKDESTGKPVKEVPIDKDNHGCDCFRYAGAEVDELQKRRPGRAKADEKRSRYQVK